MHQFIKRFSIITLMLFTPALYAGFLDQLKDIGTSQLLSPSSPTSLSVPTNLSNTDITSGLKEALSKGTTIAIEQLSKDGGFLNHSDVRIPVPSTLQPLASSLQMLGQKALVDNFQQTLNSAAESAVPEATAIFAQTIQQMSFEDATTILQGHETAATDYFKQHSSDQLVEKFLPIVKQATNTSGVTASYKQLIAGAGNLSSLAADFSPDIDQFVAEQAVEGLFLRIAEQEKLIRENPTARTTDLLKKVFTP